MYSLQSTTVEAGFVLEPLVGDRLGKAVRGRDSVAAPAETVRHGLRAIASNPAEAVGSS
jgi:hypothetical protein